MPCVGIPATAWCCGSAGRPAGMELIVTQGMDVNCEAWYSGVVAPHAHLPLLPRQTQQPQVYYSKKYNTQRQL